MARHLEGEGGSEVSHELKPCPFCGERAALGHTRYNKPLADMNWQDGSPITETYHVNCMVCLSSTTGHSALGGERTQADAAAKWNRRAPSTAEEALEWLGYGGSRFLDIVQRYYCEDDPTHWVVKQVYGPINDREARTLGKGATPLEAIRNAMKACSE